MSKYFVLRQLNLLWTLQLEALYPKVYKSVHEYGNRYCKGVRSNNFNHQTLLHIVVVLFESLRNIITFRELLDYIKVQATMKNYTIWWKQPWWSAGLKRMFFLSFLWSVGNRYVVCVCVGGHLKKVLWHFLSFSQVFLDLAEKDIRQIRVLFCEVTSNFHWLLSSFFK